MTASMSQSNALMGVDKSRHESGFINILPLSGRCGIYNCRKISEHAGHRGNLMRFTSMV